MGVVVGVGVVLLCFGWSCGAIGGVIGDVVLLWVLSWGNVTPAV